MTAGEARERLAGARVARLATAGADGRPHVVPCTFAVLGEDTIVSAVDHKPKRTTALRRLANIAANPRVAVLADHYEDDWDALWWVRVDGSATVIDEPTAAILAPLVAKYSAYATRPPEGPAIVVTLERWRGWSAR